jgi:DNA-binding transcriptional LysR family regulator
LLNWNLHWESALSNAIGGALLLTTAGSDLVERGRKILAEADNLREAARRVSDPLSGSLRVGIIPTISPYLLPVVSPTLRKEYPRLTFHWIEEKTSTLIADLNRGSLDAVLLALVDEVAISNGASLRTTRLCLPRLAIIRSVRRHRTCRRRSYVAPASCCSTTDTASRSGAGVLCRIEGA